MIIQYTCLANNQLSSICCSSYPFLMMNMSITKSLTINVNNIHTDEQLNHASQKTPPIIIRDFKKLKLIVIFSYYCTKLQLICTYFCINLYKLSKLFDKKPYRIK